MSNAKRFSVPIVLWVVALALLVVGLLASTVWKPQQEVIAERGSSQPFTMTRVGVLPLYADSVEVRATGEPDQIVWLVVGQPEDVKGWLDEEPYDEIVGLSDLETLKAITHVPEEFLVEDAQSGAEEEVAEEETDEAAEGDDPVENPLDSDMWTAMKYGRGSVSMVLSGDDLNMSVIAATDGVGPSPTLSLKWDTPQDNHLQLIAFSAAGAFALLGVILALLLAASRSRKGAKVTIVERDEDSVETAAMETLPAALAKHSTQTPLAGVAVEETSVEGVEQPEPEAPEAPREEAEPEAPGEVAQPVEAKRPAELVMADEPVEETQPEVDEEEALRKQQEARERLQEEARRRAVTETVTTESGMMNLSALQTGGAFPTRRALREARDRGVDTLIIGDEQYRVQQQGGATPAKTEDTWVDAVGGNEKK